MTGNRWAAPSPWRRPPVPAYLKGAGSLPEENKDCVVFILGPPESVATEGDFHLKTNFAFDFTMRAGELRLSRLPGGRTRV